MQYCDQRSLGAFGSSSVELAPERTGRQEMHQYTDTKDQYEIVHYVCIADIHFFEELGGLLVVTVKVVAFQLHPVETVHGVQQAVEARAEIGYVEHPAEHGRRVYVAKAETEDGEQHR